MVACGYKAIDSLRAEKGYLYWGADISADETPFEAGLGFAVSMSKDFIGKEALEKHSTNKKLVAIILEDERSIVLGNEPVRIEKNIVGRVTSGGYGVSIRASVAFAYVPTSFSAIGTELEILVFGEWIEGKIVKGPLYDPKGKKVRD